MKSTSHWFRSNEINQSLAQINWNQPLMAKDRTKSPNHWFRSDEINQSLVQIIQVYFEYWELFTLYHSLASWVIERPLNQTVQRLMIWRILLDGQRSIAVYWMESVVEDNGLSFGLSNLTSRSSSADLFSSDSSFSVSCLICSSRFDCVVKASPSSCWTWKTSSGESYTSVMQDRGIKASAWISGQVTPIHQNSREGVWRKSGHELAPAP